MGAIISVHRAAHRIEKRRAPSSAQLAKLMLDGPWFLYKFEKRKCHEKADFSRFPAENDKTRPLHRLAPTLLFNHSPYTTPYLVERRFSTPTTNEAEDPNLGLLPF